MDTVIVTGSATGLGKETALYLAAAGFRVYATVLNASQARDLQAQIVAKRLSNIQVLKLDITQSTSIANAIEQIQNETDDALALVNNAGIGLRGYFEDLAEDEIRALFETNVFGTMAITRAVLPIMRRRRNGRIVFITSIGGRIGSLGVSAYIATKFAQEGFAECLYQELSPLGIQVVIIEPAITKTERWDIHRAVARGAKNPASPYYHWFMKSEALADRMVATSPTLPEHVAKTVVRALTESRPRLRYMVGKRARLVYLLRRYLPDVVFERFYFGYIMKAVVTPLKGNSQ